MHYPYLSGMFPLSHLCLLSKFTSNLPTLSLFSFTVSSLLHSVHDCSKLLFLCCPWTWEEASTNIYKAACSLSFQFLSATQKFADRPLAWWDCWPSFWSVLLCLLTIPWIWYFYSRFEAHGEEWGELPHRHVSGPPVKIFLFPSQIYKWRTIIYLFNPLYHCCFVQTKNPL